MTKATSGGASDTKPRYLPVLTLSKDRVKKFLAVVMDLKAAALVSKCCWASSWVGLRTVTVTPVPKLYSFT